MCSCVACLALPLCCKLRGQGHNLIPKCLLSSQNNVWHLMALNHYLLTDCNRGKMRAFYQVIRIVCSERALKRAVYNWRTPRSWKRVLLCVLGAWSLCPVGAGLIDYPKVAIIQSAEHRSQGSSRASRSIRSLGSKNNEIPDLKCCYILLCKMR